MSEKNLLPCPFCQSYNVQQFPHFDRGNIQTDKVQCKQCTAEAPLDLWQLEFCLKKDDSSHDYLIAVSDEEQFDKLLELSQSKDEEVADLAETQFENQFGVSRFSGPLTFRGYRAK